MADQELRAYARIVEETLNGVLKADLPRHPLTFTPHLIDYGTGTLVVSTDVAGRYVEGRYRVPAVGACLLYRPDQTIGSLDHLLETSETVIERVIRSYNRELLSRLARRGDRGLNGVETFLPSSVGEGDPCP